MSIGGFLVWGLVGLFPFFAMGAPVIQNPESCKGGVPDGAFTCLDNPNAWVMCNSYGDYMCCTKNAQGGKDCEQIELKTSNPLGGFKGIQGGVLENQINQAPPSLSQVPKTRARTRIRRRGIEGDQSNEPGMENSAEAASPLPGEVESSNEAK